MAEVTNPCSQLRSEVRVVLGTIPPPGLVSCCTHAAFLKAEAHGGETGLLTMFLVYLEYFREVLETTEVFLGGF